MAMDWRHRAVCRDEDPELFFPVGNSGPAVLQIAEAKAVCHRCPVSTGCLAWALDNAVAGVWGGMSEDERRALKRRNALPHREKPSPSQERTPRRVPAALVDAVQRLVDAGRSNDEMAAELGESLHTVRQARALVLRAEAGVGDA
jgi:WhiB family transcriptional regulator, redox-sensing transcriptional regulator